MSGGGARRWPVHPPPRPGEALSSWLGRLAARYELTVAQLLTHNLGSASVLVGKAHEDDLDWDPPRPVLEALAERTGVDVAELRLATIAGWVPWLLESLEPVDGSKAFHTYVRQDSVLLCPGEAGANVVGRWWPWLRPERPPRRVPRRICPVCAADPDRGTPLTATLPLMLGCPEHVCRLEAEGDVALASALGRPPPHRTAPEHVLALDRLTREGLTSGTVILPQRPVHVGVWLRLLRTLLDEVSISPSRIRRHSAAALELIWGTVGRPPRAGISVWRPYEIFDITRQEAMLEAAATALDLIRTGKMTARGSLGPLLTTQPHQPAYEGDRPGAAGLVRGVEPEAATTSVHHRSGVLRTDPPSVEAPETFLISSPTSRAWAQAQEAIEEWFAIARSDPAAARQIFGILTCYSRTRDAYNRERDFMIRHGIPAAFLPDPEPGRFTPSGDVR